MGLDQYLYRSKLLRENDDEYNALVKENAEEVMYWRKANQIRQWFINNCDYPPDGNCIDFEISKEQLEDFVKDCESVLNNRSLANELMPTSSGFFFGDKEYNEWYFEQLKRTAEQVKSVIEDTDWDNEIIYYSEWW